jgi:hypothetical protein
VTTQAQPTALTFRGWPLQTRHLVRRRNSHNSAALCRLINPQIRFGRRIDCCLFIYCATRAYECHSDGKSDLGCDGARSGAHSLHFGGVPHAAAVSAVKSPPVDQSRSARSLNGRHSTWLFVAKARQTGVKPTVRSMCRIKSSVVTRQGDTRTAADHIPRCALSFEWTRDVDNGQCNARSSNESTFLRPQFVFTTSKFPFSAAV